MNETDDYVYEWDEVSPFWSTDEGKKALARMRDTPGDEALDEEESLEPDFLEESEEASG